jgi:phage-related protein
MKKSVIRHLLTALGTVLGLFGLDNFIDIFEFVNQNLDSVWAASQTLIGFVIAIVGFFKDPERHVDRVDV